MPLVFSELASVYPTKQVNDPGERMAAANGQFLLVEREAYSRSAGIGRWGARCSKMWRWRGNIKRAERDTVSLCARCAGDADVPDDRGDDGGLDEEPGAAVSAPLALAVWRVLDVLLFVRAAGAGAGLSVPDDLAAGGDLVVWLRTLWRFYARVARSNFQRGGCALSILGVPLFVFLLVRSDVQHRVHRVVEWKGQKLSDVRLSGRPGVDRVKRAGRAMNPRIGLTV